MPYRLLIEGRLVDGAGSFDVINPATGKPLTAAPHADAEQGIETMEDFTQVRIVNAALA